MNFSKKKYGITCQTCEILSVRPASKNKYYVVCFCRAERESGRNGVAVVYETTLLKDERRTPRTFISHLKIDVFNEEVLM